LTKGEGGGGRKIEGRKRRNTVLVHLITQLFEAINPGLIFHAGEGREKKKKGEG